MRLHDEQYEFIKGEVVAIFERYDVRCIPINGFELAYKMGITLIPYSSLNEKKRAAAMHSSTDGFYLTVNGNDHIYYNDIDVSYERMNMTILHEIGHCVLDHMGNKDKSDEEETEAAFFAKYAIAPPPLIHRIKPDCPEDIAYSFRISYTAAVYAYGYYKKWLFYSGTEYTEYELRLLSLFEAA